MAEGPPPFRCDKCPLTIRSRRGCEEYLEKPVYGTPPELEFYTCPVNSVTSKAQKMLMLYMQYREGYLLTSGGIGDQPGYYVDAMNVLHGMFKQHEADAIKGVPGKPIPSGTHNRKIANKNRR